MQDFEQIIKDIEDVSKDEIVGHSEFQIRNFIIGSQPTDYGRYTQCIKELRSRIKNYKNLISEIENINSKEEKTKKDIELLSEYEIFIEDISRESYILYRILQELKEILDLSDKNKLEIEYWNAKFEKELISYWMTGTPLSPSLVQNVMSLPRDQCPVVKKLENYLMSIERVMICDTGEQLNANTQRNINNSKIN